ncbi:PepSY domain-containing protein [Undibacterium sp. Rencai35W]|uniref:PepSY domain-containing protein n=1 Tax=Undibacterium sp. Rencai35W TaxID=3413046 RepID=UPI003BF2DA32
MFRFTKIAIAVTVLTTVSLGTFAYANKGMENDALAVANAKVTMIQAVTAAEQHANGKASRAEYEQSKAGWVYDVEVVSGVKVFDVRVDAEKGTIISSIEDKADRDDDHDKPD